jgi:hypothetical protein
MGEMEPLAAEANHARDHGELICPWCGSGRSERLSDFGPQLLSSQHICLDCGSPFEVIRSRRDTIE